MIAKGKTPRKEAKFGTHPRVIMKHAERGLSTDNLIVRYSLWLQTYIANGCPCLFILDVYPVHRTEGLVIKPKNVTSNSSSCQPVGGASIGCLIIEYSGK
jgi:hypothetical protein